MTCKWDREGECDVQSHIPAPLFTIQMNTRLCDKIQGGGFIYLPPLLYCPYFICILFGMPSLATSLYHNLSKIRLFMVMNLSSFSKGGGHIIKSCDIGMHTWHAVSLDLCMYACSDSAMLFLSCAWWCSNSKWCLPSIVSASSYTVLLLWSFLLNITAWTMA